MLNLPFGCSFNELFFSIHQFKTKILRDNKRARIIGDAQSAEI